MSKMRTTLALLLAVLASAHQCPPSIQIDTKPQVFIMSDISNEPDDTMSFIRLLVHSDQYNITGMVASTSYWLNSTVVPEQILNTTRAYGEVVANLQRHSEGEFPTEGYLAGVVKSGQPVYGTKAIGRTPMSEGAAHLIDVVDGLADDGILYCQAWGGANVFAEALAHVRLTRTTHDLDNFVRKLRLYTISDQDNSGPWIRLNFPQIPYIVSLHAFNQYAQATWAGISGDIYYNLDPGGPDTSLVTNSYVKQNFQIGPLGSHYPDVAYAMEGDSPSLMHTMQNGLNGGPFDQPNWGGWGGRYSLLDPSRQTMVYTDTPDSVVGINNRTYTSNHATIWRWRQAYQDEMSARIQWTILSNYSAGSHPPVVSVNGSCGSAPLIIPVSPSEEITLDASETYDPDANLTNKNPLTYHWFQYSEVSATQANTAAEVPSLNFTYTDTTNKRVVSMKMPAVEVACKAPEALQNVGAGVQETCQEYHVILEVTGSGQPPIRRYKRVILQVQPPKTSTARRRDEL